MQNIQSMNYFYANEKVFLRWCTFPIHSGGRPHETSWQEVSLIKRIIRLNQSMSKIKRST